MQSWSIEEALRVTTSTNKMEVEVLPHMAKSHVGVLIYNSTVRTEGQLPVPFTDHKGLPHKASMLVEVCRMLFSTNYAKCFCRFSYFSVSEACTGLGNCCERLRVEIFVRVLHSSRVTFNNVNNTNMFSCV